MTHSTKPTRVTGSIYFIVSVILIGTVSSILVFFIISFALDFLKKPLFEKEIYTPYPLDWNDYNNGFFALQGLNAPADSFDFYEIGRVKSHFYFLQNQKLREEVLPIPYQFERTSPDNFVSVDMSIKPFVFKHSSNRAGQRLFACNERMTNNLGAKVCLDKIDLEKIIQDNQILWGRFNKLPTYSNFQRPPTIVGQSALDASTFIALADIKAAQTILVQRNGNSNEALKEWARFMDFYSKISRMRTDPVEKAVYMLSFAGQERVLEEMLYNDPHLAVQHFDLIKRVLKPEGVSKFRGQTMLMDAWAEYDLYMYYKVYSASFGPVTDIRNKFYECFSRIDKLAELPPKVFFSQESRDFRCDNFQTYPIFESLFLTRGNPIGNFIYGMGYGGIFSSQKLVKNMHVIDARMRMTLLAVEILHKKIGQNKVVDYIQNVPVELQNPLTEGPFGWDENGQYLWFFDPTKPYKIVRFKLKIKE